MEQNRNRKILIIAIVLMAITIIGLAIALMQAKNKNSGDGKNSAEQTVTPEPTAEQTPTKAPEVTPTAGPGTPTAEPTGTKEPTGTAAPTPTIGASTPTVSGTGTPTVTATPTPKPEEIEGYLVEYSSGNVWSDGGVTMRNIEFGIRNNGKAAIAGGWKLELCRAKEYPEAFSCTIEEELAPVSDRYPAFSGVMRLKSSSRGVIISPAMSSAPGDMMYCWSP